MRIDIPADAINATTAGRREPNTPAKNNIGDNEKN